MRKIYLIITLVSLLAGNLFAQDTVSQFRRPSVDTTLTTSQKYWQWVITRSMLNYINLGCAIPTLKSDINDDISKRRGFTIGTSLVFPLCKPKYNPNGLDNHFDRPADDKPERELLFTPALKLSFNFTKCHFEVADPVTGISFTQSAKRIEFAPTISFVVFYAGPYFSKTLKLNFPDTPDFIHSNYLPSKDFGLKLGFRLIFFDFEYYWGLRDFEITKTVGGNFEKFNARTRMFTIKYEW